MVRAREARRSGVGCGGDEIDHFLFGADCRALLNPPLPRTYFGDCVKPVWATLSTTQLLKEDGFVIASKSIGIAIQERLYNKEGVLKGAEKWLMELEALKGDRTFGVSSSPKFKEYDVDFGWGRPKKSEHISNEGMQSFSLGACKDAPRDFEIGLALPKATMHAFASIFASGIES